MDKSRIYLLKPERVAIHYPILTNQAKVITFEKRLHELLGPDELESV